MSHSLVYDLPRFDLTPGPKLVITKGNNSLVTASMDFRCIKGDLSSPSVQLKLRKGTDIATLYPLIGDTYDFLQVDTFDSHDGDGGVSVVTVRFKGVDVSDDSSDGSGVDVTYSRNDALQEESIFNNPNYIASTLSDIEKSAIRLSVAGIIHAPIADEPYNLRYIKNDKPFGEFLSTDFEWWYTYIVVKGNHTWNAPVSEWTKSATGLKKLEDDALEDFGWIDEPPGEPAAPDGHVWQFSGATEDITLEGDGANSYSLSWTSGNLEPNVYTKPTPE